MSQEQVFLDAIRESPQDDAPRLVYADWLMDNGQPERGEFIHLQCRLAKMGEDDPDHDPLRDREADLLAAHAEEWLSFLPAWARERVGEFHRGFPAELRLSLAEINKGEGRLLGRAPFRGLQARRLDGWLGALARTMELRHLNRLNLTDSNLTDGQLCELMESDWLGNLTHLLLASNDIDYQGARALASKKDLARLEVLDLRENQIRSHAVAALARSPHLTNLRELLLGSAIGRPGADEPHATAALAESTSLAKLQRLDLSHHRLPEQGVAALAGATWLRKLRELELADVGRSAVLALLTAAPLQRLERLSLAHNSLGDLGATVLASASRLSGLRALDVSGNSLSAQGVATLISSPTFAALTELDLVGQIVVIEDLEDLLRHPGMKRLTVLKLGPYGQERGFSPPPETLPTENLSGLRSLTLRNLGARAAATAAALPQLRSLELGGNGLDDPDVQLLAESVNLSSLVRLDLSGNRLTAKGVTALGQSETLTGLRDLNLDGNPRVGDEGVLALAASPMMGRLIRLGLGHSGRGLTARGIGALIDVPAPRLTCLDLRGATLSAAMRKQLRQRFGGRVLFDRG